jgi:hypothetical protein
MPTITAGSTVAKAKIICQDTTGIRWPDEEWLGWYNDAQREIAMLKASAFTKVASVPMVAGTKQTLPADAISFVEYIRWLGADGNTPGRSARKVERRMLDSGIPNWHTATPAAQPQHIVHEPLAPKTFYNYPPLSAAGFAEVLYIASPPEVTSLSQVMPLDDIYANPILDYLLYRAYLKDSEDVGNAERSLLHRKAFESTLGMKAAVEQSVQTKSTPKG